MFPFFLVSPHLSAGHNTIEVAIFSSIFLKSSSVASLPLVSSPSRKMPKKYSHVTDDSVYILPSSTHSTPMLSSSCVNVGVAPIAGESM